MKKLFSGLDLEVEDLYLLESFQIADLENRAPSRELAAILHSRGDILSFFLKKSPQMAEYFNQLMTEFGPAKNQHQLDEFIDLVIWEIALMIVMNKCPEVYEDRHGLGWDLEDIIVITPLDKKIIADIGAGTGKIAFTVVNSSTCVYAVEPSASFRNYMRDKAKKMNIENLYVMDGFLNAIPLHNSSLDVLITSNAIGWSIDAELLEIERVVKPKGLAIHLLIGPKQPEFRYIHDHLTSPEHNYHVEDLSSGNLQKLKYWKQFEVEALTERNKK